MRVAVFVVNFPSLSETFVVRQICDLIDQGVDVDIVAFRPGLKAIHHSDIEKYALLKRTHYLSHVNINQSKFFKAIDGFKAIVKTLIRPDNWVILRTALYWIFNRNFRDAKRLLEISIEAKKLPDYDVILAHFGPTGVIAHKLRKAGIIVNTPIATIFHGNDMSDMNVIKKSLSDYKELFLKTELLLPISNFWAFKLKEWGAPPEKTDVIHMGIDIDSFQINDHNRKINKPLRVLTVGRATEKKGIAYGIKAVADCDFAIEYRIIGGGELLENLRKTVNEQNLQDKIKLLGAQPNVVVLENLKWADVFMLPSVTAIDGDMEGIPVVLMEAMAMGVIVISTWHSGIPELIEDSISGFLVPEKDHIALTQCLKKISNGYIDASQIRRSARKKIEKDFNSRLLSKKLIKKLSNISKDG